MRLYCKRRQLANARLLLPVSRLHRQRNTLLNHTQVYNVNQGKCLIHLRFRFNIIELHQNYYHILQHYREAAGFTRAELGNLTGVSAGVVQNYESLRNDLYYESALMFADALNINVDLLLDDYTRFTAPGFGDKIRAIRNRFGLSQAQIADHIGTRKSTIAIWEIELHRPSREMYQKLLPLWKGRDRCEPNRTENVSYQRTAKG